jgi:radical SAM superfamily enzyme YgiQ (UPF0313 family)
MDPTESRGGDGPRVLLVNPWIYDFAAYNLWARPVGLLYIAAVLRDHGYRIHLLDCLDNQRDGSDSSGTKGRFGCGNFPKEIVPKPRAYREIPRRYGRYGIAQKAFLEDLSALAPLAAILVTSGMTYWYPGVFRAIELLRAHLPDTPVLLGGIYATLCARHAGEHSGADLVIEGPGEAAALQAVDRISGRASDPLNPQDLDQLPFPAFDLYGRSEYACLLTSRGCPYACTYCASRQVSGEYRRRSPENVLAELEWLNRRLGIANIAFYDDALLMDADLHIKPILEGTLHKELDCWFHTPNGLHARLVDREVAELMFRSGFKTVRLSLETADRAISQRTGPKATRDDLIRALEHLSRAGYRREEIGVYLLAGLPGQMPEEITKSVDFVIDQGALVKLALYSPIPGTAEWQRAVRCGSQDPEADPLLHNNTVFPASSPVLPIKQLEAIKLHVKRQNATLS